MTDEQKTERVQLLMTPSEVKAVDDWSFDHRVRGRSEAIRRLIEAGLRAEAAPVSETTAPTLEQTEGAGRGARRTIRRR
jgi:hypothetical protein